MRTGVTPSPVHSWARNAVRGPRTTADAGWGLWPVIEPVASQPRPPTAFGFRCKYSRLISEKQFRIRLQARNPQARVSAWRRATRQTVCPPADLTPLMRSCSFHPVPRRRRPGNDQDTVKLRRNETDHDPQSAARHSVGCVDVQPRRRQKGWDHYLRYSVLRSRSEWIHFERHDHNRRRRRHTDKLRHHSMVIHNHQLCDY